MISIWQRSFMMKRVLLAKGNMVDKELLAFVRQRSAAIAAEIVNVQPMEGIDFQAIIDNCLSETELTALGFEPVSQFGLMWVKKD